MSAKKAAKKSAKKAAKKAAKSIAKKSAKKGTKRGAKPRTRRETAIIDPGAPLSSYGKNVLRAFDSGVQEAYARMASAGVAATVVVDGKVVRAVPHRQGGRFVVSEPTPQRASSRHRVR